MNFVFRAQNSQPIRGSIKSDVSIVRTISGLRIPIRCYLMEGNYVGSCVYNDFCQILKDFCQYFLNFTSENCLSFSANNSMDINTAFNVPDLVFSTPWYLSWFRTLFQSGDFDVGIKLTQEDSSILCLNFKYSMKPK